MKSVIHFFSATLVLIICFQTALACTVAISPLRKQFRRADAVFVGKVLKVAEYSPTLQEKDSLPEYVRDWEVFSKISFEVKNNWKGNLPAQKDFIAVAYFICGCSSQMSQFKEGQEFLVFAERNNFVHICDSSDVDEEETEKTIKRLNRFWFRAWASAYPF